MVMNAPTPLGILLVNQTWFAAELRAAGHNVVTAGWAHDGFDLRFNRLSELNDVLGRLPDGFHLDRIVYFDDSYSASLVGLEGLPVPSIFYSIDAHHHWHWHAWFGALFDLVLVAQRDYIHLIRHTNPELEEERVVWSPLWAPLDIGLTGEERTIDVSFRGTLDADLHPERAAFFAGIAEQVQIDAGAGRYEDVYRRSKIVLNQSVSNDVNFRVYEAIMCGAMLVTPQMENGLRELFEDGVHLRTYPPGDVNAAAAIIREMLADDEARERIARAGREEVVARHRACVRANEIADRLAALPFKAKPRRYFSSALSALHGLGTYRPIFSPEAGDVQSYRDRLIARARECLLRSVVENEPVDEEFRAMALLCKCYLQLVSTQEELLEFSGRLRRACPGDLMLNLSYVEDLLALGRNEEAERVANEISHSPQELMASLPAILGAARERVLGSMRPIAEN